MSDKNLHQRIVAIMADMGAVGKTGQTTEGPKYAYRQIDEIDDALRFALVKHGVVATLTNIDNRRLEHFEATDRSGKPRTTWYAECTLDIQLANADKPDDTLMIKGWGQGLDFSDKATGKAIAYAAKAAYLSAFHLRGQPDNEQDDIPRTPQQAPKLSKEDEKLIANAKADIAKATSTADLDAMAAVLKTYPINAKKELGPSWRTRYAELEKQEKDSEHSGSDQAADQG